MEIKLHVFSSSVYGKYEVDSVLQEAPRRNVVGGGGGGLSVTTATDGRLNVTITLHPGKFPLIPIHLVGSTDGLVAL
jgi:hypothetical protein